MYNKTCLIVGLLLLSTSVILFDSSVINLLGAVGNQGVLPLLSLFGAALIALGSRIERKSHLSRAVASIITLISIFILWQITTTIIAFPKNLTSITISNLAIQVLMWSGVIFIITHTFHLPPVGSETYWIPIALTTAAGLLHLADIGTFNLNWLGLSVFLAVSIWLVSQKNTNLRNGRIFLVGLGSAALALLILGSRGVTLMIIALFGSWFLFVFFGRWTKFFSTFGLLLVSFVSGVLGVWFFQTDLFDQLDNLSRAWFDKPLSISRFERWTAVLSAALNNNDLAVSGVGLAGFSTAEYRTQLTASHNMYIDTLFFLGWPGWGIRIMISIAIFSALSNIRNLASEYFGNALLAALALGSVYYGLLGFTHLPGTIFGLFGLALAISKTQTK